MSFCNCSTSFSCESNFSIGRSRLEELNFHRFSIECVVVLEQMDFCFSLSFPEGWVRGQG